MSNNVPSTYKRYHYSVLSSDQLSYIHRTTLEMLKIIVPILENNDITYFVCGGTLRGALLMSGFLPWDEDIDLCVAAYDYDRMIDVLVREVPDWMFVQCEKTEPKYYHGWIKIRDKKSHLYPDEPLYQQNGVLIDIYKISFVEEIKLDFEIAKEHLRYLKRRYDVGGITKEEFDNRVKSNNLIERTNKVFSDTNFPNKCIIWSGKQVVFEFKYCFPRKRILFEHINLFSFKNCVKYLIAHYGCDYTKLPKDNERMIDFNYVDFDLKF